MAKKAKTVLKIPPQKKHERGQIQLKIKEPKKDDIKPKDIFQGYSSEKTKKTKK